MNNSEVSRAKLGKYNMNCSKTAVNMACIDINDKKASLCKQLVKRGTYVTKTNTLTGS